MNENSYLNPADIRAQCDAAINSLEKDNEATYIIERNLNSFIEDSQVQSYAFKSLKQQMEDYKSVLPVMRMANQADIEDFRFLKLMTTGTELNGSNILEQKNMAIEAKKSDEANAEKYRKKAQKATSVTLRVQYTTKVTSYMAMAALEQKLYDECQKKEDTYDGIEKFTCGLFEEGASIRAAVESALSGIQGAFQNGVYVPDMQAAWRGEISSCYIDRVMTINADGTITTNWAEVRRILNKDAEEITEEEYNALAVLYLNMGEEDLAQFLKLCMDKTKDVKDTSKWIGNGSGAYTDNKEDYSVWEIDGEKVQNILDRVVVISDERLLALQMVDGEVNAEIYDALTLQRNIILQRTSLLKTVREIGEFRGWYQEEEPVVSVEIDEVGVITLKFCERRDVCDTACTQMSNMGESSVEISETRNKTMINWEAIKQGKISVEGYLGISSCGEGSDISEYALEQLGNQILGNVIGSVPYVGGALTFIMDATDATAGYQGGLKEAQFIKGEFEQLEEQNIYTIFGCSANLISYDAADNTEKVLYVQPGADTQVTITRVNNELGTKITMEDVITSPIEVWKVIDQLLEANPENRERFNRAIRTK